MTGDIIIFQSLLCVLFYGVSQFLWPCQIRDILYHVNLDKPSHWDIGQTLTLRCYIKNIATSGEQTIQYSLKRNKDFTWNTQSSSWFTSLVSRQRDYQFCPWQQHYIRPISVGEQEHLKLAPVESSKRREKQKRLGYQQIYLRSYWELLDWKKNIPLGELLDQYLGIGETQGETLKQFRTKNPKINTLLRTTLVILLLLCLGQRTKYSTRCLILKPFIVISFLSLEFITNKLRSADKISHAGIVLPCL